MIRQPIYNTALYLRLSKDDELQGESSSITNQRKMLRQYAEENRLIVIGEYVDDGWSGTNFDRPGFQRMLEDIEAGKINCVITKDLSRLGRNYILTGQYTEFYFPTHNVRYIAINDGVDSVNGESEIAPFKNIINEWYARDTSRKVKSALRVRQAEGAHYSSYVPLGYKRDPDQKGKLIIDDSTRWIIDKIFDLAYGGVGYKAIAKILADEKVPTPAYVNYQNYGNFSRLFDGTPEYKKYLWYPQNVKRILSSELYLGHSIHGRVSTRSFKDRTHVPKPENEWLRVENTHEPLVTQDVFDHIQSQSKNRRKKKKDGVVHPFAGLVKCADCGWSMSLRTVDQSSGRYSHFCCGRYARVGKYQCSSHYIRYDALYDDILCRLKYWLTMAKQNESALLNKLQDMEDKESNTSVKHVTTELKAMEKRQSDIDSLFTKLYEDRLEGKITERNFLMLSEKYQKEQEELTAVIPSMQKQIQNVKDKNGDTRKWIQLVNSISNLDKLDHHIVSSLIERIEIHQAVNCSDGKSEQKVDIFYRFIGKVNV